MTSFLAFANAAYVDLKRVALAVFHALAAFAAWLRPVVTTAAGKLPTPAEAFDSLVKSGVMASILAAAVTVAQATGNPVLVFVVAHAVMLVKYLLTQTGASPTA